MTHSVFARFATLRRLAPEGRRPQPPKRNFCSAGIFLLLSLCAACDILEEDLSGRTVRVIAPMDGTALPPGEVTFRWEAVEGASGYALRVVTPSFAEAGRIVADTLLRADTLGAARSYGCRVRLDAGDYEWTVEAFNGAYATQPCIMRLSVVEIPPAEEPETPERPDNALHFSAGISTGEAVRRRRRYCTSSGELQSAAGDGGELPTAPSAVESSKRNSIGITDSSPLP